MNKLIVVLSLIITILLFASGSYAETIKEETFASMGYEKELFINEANKKECQTITFFDEFNAEEYTIISVHFAFTPNIKGDANITVKLNNELVSEISSEKREFERIIIKKEKLKEKNLLELCGHTSDSITQLKVLNDSLIGNYKTAFFPEGSFTKKVLSKELVVGKEITIKTTLKNYGNETALVEIIDGDKERNDIELIKGKSAFTGEIKAGEEISLEFTYKLKDEKTGLLPNATAVYLNEFEEKQTIKSNYPEIKPLDFEKKLEPIIMLKKQLNKVNSESEIEIVIINNSLETVHNSTITVFGAEELKLGETEKQFESINSGEIVFFKTNVKSVQSGEFELDCEIEFEGQKISCEKTTIIFEKEEIKQELIIGIILVIIGIIIYLYLYLR